MLLIVRIVLGNLCHPGSAPHGYWFVVTLGRQHIRGVRRTPDSLANSVNGVEPNAPKDILGVRQRRHVLLHWTKPGQG